jgi:hypothetical protein
MFEIGSGFSIRVEGCEKGGTQFGHTKKGSVNFSGNKRRSEGIRVGRGIIHHTVVDLQTGDFGNVLVTTRVAARTVSCKTKSKQSRRVWVNWSKL